MLLELGGVLLSQGGMLAALEEGALADAHVGEVVAQHGGGVGLRVLGTGGLSALQDLLLQVGQGVLSLLGDLGLLFTGQGDAQILGHGDIHLVVDEAVEDVVLQALHARLGGGVVVLPVAIVLGVHIIGVDVAIVVAQGYGKLVLADLRAIHRGHGLVAGEVVVPKGILPKQHDETGHQHDDGKGHCGEKDNLLGLTFHGMSFSCSFSKQSCEL